VRTARHRRPTPFVDLGERGVIEVPVSTIADQLGFDEATNFVEFFRREAGWTPGAFRTRTCTS